MTDGEWYKRAEATLTTLRSAIEAYEWTYQGYQFSHCLRGDRPAPLEIRTVNDLAVAMRTAADQIDQASRSRVENIASVYCGSS